MILKNKRLTALALSITSLFSMANDDSSVEFSGTIMLDYDNFDALFIETADEAGSNTEIRHLRLGVDSDFASNWRAKLSVDVKDGVDIKDAYLNYYGWQAFELTIGKQKEPFGLENQMSSKNSWLIERAMISNVIAPDRSIGIKASGEIDTVSWQLGYFQDDNSEKSTSITGRLTWAPWLDDNNLVHVGTSFSERNLRGDDFRINQDLEVNTADSLIEGVKFNADSASLKGLELLWQYRGLSNMAEWQQTNVQANDGTEYVYQGGYYQMSYLLSGKNRKYKNGELGGLKTKNDWEVSLRYSQLYLQAENSEAQVFSVGLNYYFDKDLKIMANYLNAEYVEQGINLGSGNALSIRAQYQF